MTRHSQNRSFLISILWVLISLSLFQASSWAQKRPLTHDDYDSWKMITHSQLSPNGSYLLYLETPQDGDAYLIVKDIESGQEWRQLIGYSGEGTDAERSAGPAFSADSRRVFFLISPNQEEVQKRKKEKKKAKPPKKLGILNLDSGQTEVIDSVKSFSAPEDNGRWLGYLLVPPKKKKNEKKKEEKAAADSTKEKTKPKKKEYGSPFVLRDLASGQSKSVNDVLSFQFTKDGKWLLYIISSKEHSESDGVYAMKLPDLTITPLLTGQGNYKRLTLNKDETVLAFLTDRDTYDSEQSLFALYGCPVGSRKAELWVSHTQTANFPAGFSVSDKSSLQFSNDGKVVLFGIKEIPEKKEESDSLSEEKAKFELWHWNDPYPQPQQKKMAAQVKNNTFESVYFIKDKKFVRLATPEIPDVSLHPSGKIAYANNPWPYTKRVSYFGRFSDVYIFDLKTGRPTLVKKELYGSARLSPEAKYVYWFENNHWFVYDIRTKRTVNLTERLNVPFDRQDWDTPSPARPYGVAGWTKKDRSILIYDQFDIWEIAPDGSKARRITEGYGREHHLSFRYVNLDPEERNIDPEKPLLLQATDEETMDQGFFLDRVNGTEPPQQLIMAAKSFSTPRKAKESATLLFSRSAFNEYPDLWVSDPDFRSPKKITDLGKQMEPFRWGKAELYDFKSSDGKPLKGILITPEDFDPSNQYPLLVYIYETLHYNLHRFRHPSPGTSINPSYYVSNGYLIWMPDIEYGTGYPGRDALKCVLPGIQMLIRKGFVDPKRIGIQGHSWGGYQIAYMVTQTNIFAAAEAGAPVSNMISAYGGIRWGSGMVRQFQYEHTQSRIGGSIWEYPLRYIENSPIFWADKVQTPLLMIHNDKDGAVPWYQGIEYIMALRRLGKEAYMFNYNGEDHGLRKRVNQKDWTIRMQQFFDHFLKGAPKPDWMVKGIKAWEKE